MYQLKKIIFRIVGIIAILFILYFILHPFIYEIFYFKKIGIKGSHLYKDIVASKGEPNSFEDTGDGYANAIYDGLIIILRRGRDDYIFSCAEITGKQYRFGLYSIGVGSSRKQVESADRNVREIVDTGKNEFGLIDNGVWVSFFFDTNNKVNKILIYYGP